MSQFPRELVIPGPNGLPVGAVASPCKRIYTTEDGAPCCGCEFVYLLELCNPTCAPEYRFKHICGNTQCPATGPYQGPLVPGTVIKQGSRCYRLNDPTKFCPPGLTCHHPNYPPLPVRTTAITGTFTCRPDCSPAACPPLQGFYQLWTCSCEGATAPTNFYICCSAYEEALQTTPCPVWFALTEGQCTHVPPGAVPVATVPPEGTAVCFPHQFNDCRECCCQLATTPPECCRCTSDSVITRWLGNSGFECGFSETRTPACWFSARTSTFQGCLFRKHTLPNGCVSLFDCITVSGLTVTRRRWDGPQGGPSCNANVLASCPPCGTALMEVLNFEQTSYGPFDPCDIPSQLIPVDMLPGASNPPPACPIGQELQSCTQYDINYFTQGSLLGGVDVQISGHIIKTSPPGVCGNDCGGVFGSAGQLVNPDGTPIGRKPSERIVVASAMPGGCTDCVGGQATSRF